MAGDKNNNKAYFERVAERIDIFEGRIKPRDQSPEFGEVDYDDAVVIEDVEPASTRDLDLYQGAYNDSTNDLLPKIEGDRLESIVDLYKNLNKQYGLKVDVDSITDIASTYKALVNQDDLDAFKIYLRENIDRLKVACLSQLSNTVYVLIGKITSEEVIASLTILERVALLDRMFEYMDKINNMTSLLPQGDTKLELKELSERKPSDEGQAKGRVRNRELEEKILKHLNL